MYSFKYMIIVHVVLILYSGSISWGAKLHYFHGYPTSHKILHLPKFSHHMSCLTMCMQNMKGFATYVLWTTPWM